MKNYICIIALLCTNLMFSKATNKPVKVDSEITAVTVYRLGAQIKREIVVDVPIGRSVFLIQGIEENINDQTIRIELEGQALIESIQYENQKVEDVYIDHSSQVQILQDSINLIEQMSSVYKLEEDMILSNKRIISDNSVDYSTTLNNTATIFRKRLLKITNILFNNEMKIRNWKNEVVELQKLSKPNKHDKLQKQIVLSLYSEKTYQDKISIQFLIAGASWDPFYEVKVGKAADKIKLLQKAKVRQNSGRDWENIPLTLSTSNPNISNSKPDLQPYFLTYGNFYTEPYYYDKSLIHTNSIRGIIRNTDGEPLIGASVYIKGTSIGTITDLEGKFSFQTNYGKYRLIVSYVGYQSMTIPVTSQYVQARLHEGGVLNEVIVTGSSRSNKYEDDFRIRQKEQKQRPLPIAISNSEISTSFAIRHPISIPATDEAFSVMIAIHEINANFHYMAVPKLSPYAYLHAELTGWDDLELLDGKGNVYFNDSYEGETFFKFQGISDTLALSIGRDQNVVIKRQLVKNFSKDQFLSKHIKKIRKWKTSISNAKDHEIKVIIEDHYPVSKDGAIKVKIPKDELGFLEMENGLLQKSITIASKEKHTYELEYEVTHNKNLKLFVE